MTRLIVILIVLGISSQSFARPRQQQRQRTHSSKKHRRFIGRTFNTAYRNSLRRYYKRIIPHRGHFRNQHIERLVRGSMRRGIQRPRRSTYYNVPHQTITVFGRRNRNIRVEIYSSLHDNTVYRKNHKYKGIVYSVFYKTEVEIERTERTRYYYDDNSWYYTK